MRSHLVQTTGIQLPIGHNMLDKLLKLMFNKAGLDCERITNHSLRATAISRMYNENVPEKLIMEQSEHLSKEGVRSYERTTGAQLKRVSDILSDITSASSSQMNVQTTKPVTMKVGSTSKPVKKVGSSSAPYEQDADQFDDFFKCIPEESYG